MSNKRIKIDPEEIRKRVEAAKAKKAQQAQERQIHPLLLMSQTEKQAEKVDIPVISQHSDTKANQRLVQQQRVKAQKPKPNPYLSTAYKIVQPPKAFKFLPQGKATLQAERQRQEAAKNQAQRLAELEAKHLNLLVTEETFDKSEVPLIEWWDAQVFKDSQICEGAISDLVQHPRIMRYDQLAKPEVQHLHLTQHEIRKTRRIRRAEAQRERQEQINLGLLPPDPPKVKLSNMMRVNGVAELTAQEPTAIELEVLKQVHQREQKHLQSNQERKLTEDERRIKLVRKYAEDLTSGVHAQVYKCHGLLDKQQLYKIQTNASQHHLSGYCLQQDDIAVVIVEGGSKGLRRFKHLLEDRIQWSDNQSCRLLWEGQFGHISFKNFKAVYCETGSDVKRLLGDEFYFWQLAKYS